jgi:hypothetical protein
MFVNAPPVEVVARSRQREHDAVGVRIPTRSTAPVATSRAAMRLRACPPTLVNPPPA